MTTTGELTETIAGASAAHARLARTVAELDDDVARRPSLLPGWTVAHVLAHLARNAESHVRMLEAALEGRSVEQYPGGHQQRSRDIDEGACLPAARLQAESLRTSSALEAAWSRMTPDAWRGHGLAGGREWPCRVLPFHRWREVEIHHVDLGLGYEPEDWPEAYVQRELPLALAAVPDRVGPADARRLLSWLVGRGEHPVDVELSPWQERPEHYHLVPAALRELQEPLP